jgi:hypothetical protein
VSPVIRRFAVLLAAGLVAAAAVPAASQETPPDRFAGIRDLLARRSEAMLAGDEEAFMATVDRGDPEFVKRQRLLFEGFRLIGLEDYRLDLTFEYWPELTTDVEIERYGEEAQPHVLHVEERYRLAGYDRQPALEDLFLTFVNREGEWLVASDTDLDDLRMYSGRKLWEFEPVVIHESEHFLYVSPPELGPRSDFILGAAERALDTLDQEWPEDWSRRVPIFVPETTAQLDRILQATFDLEVFVAFAYSGVDRARDWDLVGHRVILNWPNFSRNSEEFQQTILVHELLHVATREYSGPHTSVFVDEGIAELVSNDTDTYEITADLAAGRFDRALPRDYEFITGEQSDIIQSYQESYTAMRFATVNFGLDAVADFYRILGEARLAPGTSRYHVGRAMEATFDLSFPEFEEAWAEWAEDNL